jgi:ABC-type polysaccharide/polyol phosphate transport system ATPase subunit
MAHIQLQNVSVDYPVLQSHHRSFKRLLMPSIEKSRLAADSRNRVVLQALKGINLNLADGDRVALIGSNGAGKSSLLKVMAGIYPPTAGNIFIDGRIGALLTTGLGMRDDVSGYENIDFCLLLQGVRPEDLPERRAEVVAFSELGEYLDLNVGVYSSGMRVRLAFAISTSLEPDVLLIDEVFGAGDVGFMRKARARMTTLISKTNLLVFASHSADLVEQFCNKAVWLDNGEVREFGPVAAVNSAYLLSMS